jgi:uncharacterized protein YdeI (YjbR/CyaY-like superfamily)
MNSQASKPPLHDLPDDMARALNENAVRLQKWNGLTELGRNEWICWTITCKKPETRAHHIERMKEELLEGKRRPCCWPGCPHRRPGAAKWFSKGALDNSKNS